jgi:basic membrane protein A and related proteins
MPPADPGPLAVNRRQLIGLGALGAAALALPVRRALAAERLKIAGVFGTPIEEPWVNQIHVALLRAKGELGVEYIWSENVKASDFGRVLREHAQKGANLVMGDAFTDEEASRRAAKAYPKVAFVMGSGLGPADPNFGVFDNWIHEPAYLCGMIAGKLTKSNTIGAVAAMPIPEVNRLVNAYHAGAKEVNKGIRCKFSFIDSFFDPPKAKEAALAQIEAGVDAVYAERFGVIEAAHDKGIIAFSNMSDQSAIAPETVVTGPIWDMWPTVDHVVKLVRADLDAAQDFGGYSYMGKGGSYLAPYHAWESKLSPEIKEMVAKRTREIKDGAFRVDVDEAVPVSD